MSTTTEILQAQKRKAQKALDNKAGIKRALDARRFKDVGENQSTWENEIYAIEPPFDTLSISENGEHDVKDYKKVNVGIVAQGDEVLIDLIEGDIAVLNIPYGVKKIRNYFFYYLFGFNMNGVEVTIPDSVTELEAYAFAEGRLKSVTIPNTISKIPNYCFYKSNLPNIEIPESVTEIGQYAFQACHFTNLEIPDSVTIIGRSAFYNCYKLISIKLPNNIETLPQYMLSSCRELKEVIIPNSVTSIGGRAFADCNALEKINLPKNITILEDYLFENCKALKEITIPESVTNIYGGVFSNCTALTNLIIPKNVTNIGNYALRIGSTTDKATIIIESETPCTITSSSITKANIERIFVPQGCRTNFISATNWSSLADIIVERNNVIVNIPSGLLNNENYTYSLDNGETYNQFTQPNIALENVALIKVKSTTPDTTIIIGTTAGGNDIGTIANSELTFSFSGDTTIYLTIQ